MLANPTQSGIPTRQSDPNQVMRSKNKKRDEAIRKRVEQELTKRTNKKRNNSDHSNQKKSSKGTVSSLRPAPAIIILETAKIIQAAQLMAAKRCDAVLAVNQNGNLVGILTDKDIAFRVVAEGLDIRTTSVQDVMTPDPIAVHDHGSRNEALNIMISRRFRHLPVISDGDLDENEDGGTSVVGLLDITKCVFERLEDLERKVNEDQSIISAMEVLERRGSVNADRVDTMRNEHECPTISSLLKKINNERGSFPAIPVKCSVKDAAKMMKLYHSTAVLAQGTPDGADKVAGIFTTKDIVLRVLAASLDPNTTSVIRVMTPHPDFVNSDASILDALKKLHTGHFLHLPVIDATVPMGLIDVMTLTIAMLTYLVNKTGGSPGEEGPQWNTFWNSTFAGAHFESDRHSQTSETRLCSSVYFREKASMSRIEQTPEPSIRDSAQRLLQTPVPDGNFTFKLRDMSVNNGKIYRFSSPCNSLQAMYDQVCSKTGYTTKYTPEDPTLLDFITSNGTTARLCYLDDEGDIVSIESDKDLLEAVYMCYSLHASRLMIFLGDPPADMPCPSPAVSIRTDSPPLIVQKPSNDMIQQLKDAQLSLNVAISAGIVVVAFYVMCRIAKMN